MSMCKHAKTFQQSYKGTFDAGFATNTTVMQTILTILAPGEYAQRYPGSNSVIPKINRVHL